MERLAERPEKEDKWQAQTAALTSRGLLPRHEKESTIRLTNWMTDNKATPPHTLLAVTLSPRMPHSFGLFNFVHFSTWKKSCRQNVGVEELLVN